MATTFPVQIMTPEGAAYEGTAEMVSTRTLVGSIGIRANHEPLMAMLDPTELRIYESGGQRGDRAARLDDHDRNDAGEQTQREPPRNPAKPGLEPLSAERLDLLTERLQPVQEQHDPRENRYQEGKIGHGFRSPEPGRSIASRPRNDWTLFHSETRVYWPIVQ